MPAPWWESYPQKYCAEIDWQKWEAAGKPKLPRAMRVPLPDAHERPLVLPEPRHTLTTGAWVGRAAKPTRRDARARSVDALLAKLGIK